MTPTRGHLRCEAERTDAIVERHPLCAGLGAAAVAYAR
jgi:hypothetical protein